MRSRAMYQISPPFRSFCDGWVVPRLIRTVRQNVMAMIACPECSEEVSEFARSCPHCGYPVEGSEYTTLLLPKSIPIDKALPDARNQGWTLVGEEECLLGDWRKYKFYRPFRRL